MHEELYLSLQQHVCPGPVGGALRSQTLAVMHQAFWGMLGKWHNAINVANSCIIYAACVTFAAEAPWCFRITVRWRSYQKHKGTFCK